jgi:D-glycero-D-manno-heptose 1,7-bisphosphate phosphatase
MIICDLDGTLIRAYLAKPRIPYDEIQVLPGRREKLAFLTGQGVDIAIATNQGGVAFGYVSEEQAHAKIQRAIAALGLPDDTPYAVCFADARSPDPRYNDPSDVARRKPSGAMIRELADGVAFDQVLFVGDRPEDEQAAADAGVAFEWADDFFIRGDDDVF